MGKILMVCSTVLEIIWTASSIFPLFHFLLSCSHTFPFLNEHMNGISLRFCLPTHSMLPYIALFFVPGGFSLAPLTLPAQDLC